MNIWWDIKEIKKTMSAFQEKHDLSDLGSVWAAEDNDFLENGREYTTLFTDHTVPTYKPEDQPALKEGMWIIFAQSQSSGRSNWGGFITQIKRVGEKTLSCSPAFDGEDFCFPGINDPDIRVIPQEFVELMGWESSRIAVEPSKGTEPCPLCGRPIGCFRGAPACRECNIFQNIAEGAGKFYGNWLKIGTMELVAPIDLPF